jgi:cellulose synthase/poly-beta-1,6-N-acetylglucosamine synthase-like glycosyltransferase
MAIVFQIVFWSAAGLFVYSYGGYALVLRLLARFTPRDTHTRTTPSSLPMVTILVPAYNEEKVIREKCENALALDYPKQRLEILVASDASTDATTSIVRSFSHPSIRCIDFPDRSGKTGVINASLPEATGEIIVFTDANTMFRPDALTRLIAGYEDPSVGAVCGHVRLVPPANAHKVHKEIAYREFEARMKYIEGLFGATIGAFGGFYSIRKELFTPLPANAFSNDDFLIPMHILSRGYRVIFTRDALATEDTGKSIEDEFKRRVRIGAGNFQSFSLLPGMLNPCKGTRFFFYFSHKLLRWFSPFILLAILVANILLWPFPLYRLLLAGQLALYGMALCGFLLAGLHRYPPVITSLYHFVSMNVALLSGFFRFFKGIKSSVWESTERNIA